MKIIYSAPDIGLNDCNGGSAHVSGVINAMHKAGHNVNLICNSGEIDNIIKIKKFKSGLFRVLNYFFSPFFITVYLCLKEKPDIIYERARIFGGGAILAGKLFDIKSIYEMNEPIGEDNNKLKKIIFNWHMIISRLSNLVTGTHPKFFLGIEKSKQKLVHYGIDPEKFSPEVNSSEIIKKYNLENSNVILYIGSFAKWHSCENIIKAAELIIKKDKKIKFLMAGDGEKLEKCRELTKILKIHKSIIFTGKIEYSDMPKYINASTICLALFDRNYFANDYYFSPIKVHEYKACGKPIIASNIGNLKNLVKNNENGLTVNENKIEDICNKIIILLKNKDLYRKISINNRKEIEKNYNWLKITEDILKSAINN